MFEPIALRTGELYQTTELTRDGAVPQFSPDGRHLLYETGPVATRITRVLSVADPARPVVELRGGGASFSTDGAKIGYWKAPDPSTTLPESAAVAARAALYDLATGRESAA